MGQINKKTKRKTKGKAKFKMVTSPLSNAIVNDDLKKVKNLLKKGANPNEFTNEWCSSKVKPLREHLHINCEVYEIWNKGDLGTLLHLALFLRNKKIIHALLDHSVDRIDVNKTHIKDDYTSLHFAVYCGLDIVKKIYKLGCTDINRKDMDGNPVLMHTLLRDYTPQKDSKLDIIKFLIDKGAFVNVKNKKDGYTPLDLASRLGHIDVIKYLISKGAHINNLNKRNRTPLHECIVSSKNSNANKLQVVKLLIDKGAKINTISKETRHTPLSSATAYGLSNIVKLLLSKGSKKNIKNKDNMTALDVAKWNNYKSIENMLQ